MGAFSNETGNGSAAVSNALKTRIEAFFDMMAQPGNPAVFFFFFRAAPVCRALSQQPRGRPARIFR